MNADTINHAKPKEITVGDKVLAKQRRYSRLTTLFDLKPYTVVAVKETMVITKRHRS